MKLLSVLALSVFFPASPELPRVVSRGDPVRAEKLPAEIRVEASTSRAWILAAAAVPAERGSFSHEILSGASSTAENLETYRKFLKARWSIERRVDLIARLDKIDRNDPRELLSSLMQGFRKSKLTEQDIDAFFKGEEREHMKVMLRSSKRMTAFKSGFLAFELVTSAVLIRQGYGAGYLEEAEVWRRLEPIAKRLQKAYGSFEEAGEVWCIALEVLGDADAASSRTAFEKLSKDESSPWKKTPWDLKLTKLDAPPPKDPAK